MTDSTPRTPPLTLPDTVTLWTFQPRAFYDHLLAHGVTWIPDPKIAEPDWGKHPDDNWGFSYDWMTRQMRAKGIVSPHAQPVPHAIWAWWWWHGEKMKKPRLNYSGSWSMRGSDGCVLLRVEVPRDWVCVSDYDAWHSVLNHGLCASCEAEHDDFHRRVDEAMAGAEKKHSFYLPPGPLRDEMEASWQRIFDITLVDNYYLSDYATRNFQATLFGFRREHLKEAWWLPPRGAGRKARLPI